MRKPLAILILLATGCMHEGVLEDAAIRTAGVELGASAVTLATLEEDATDDDVTDAASAVGEDLLDLVAKHLAIVAPCEVPDEAAPDLHPSEDGVSWQAGALVATFLAGADHYDLALTVFTEATPTEPADADTPTPVALIRGPSDVKPIVLTDTFEMQALRMLQDRPTEVRVHAEFIGFTVLDGCPIAGHMDLAYRVSSEAGEFGNRIRAGWQGCDDVTVSSLAPQSDQ